MGAGRGLALSGGGVEDGPIDGAAAVVGGGVVGVVGLAFVYALLLREDVGLREGAVHGGGGTFHEGLVPEGAGGAGGGLALSGGRVEDEDGGGAGAGFVDGVVGEVGLADVHAGLVGEDVGLLDAAGFGEGGTF